MLNYKGLIKNILQSMVYFRTWWGHYGTVYSVQL